MIKGIIALFSSGLILAPQVLFGIILGFIFGSKLTIEQIKELYCTPIFYIIVFCAVSLYVYMFKLTYKNRRGDIDWEDNFLRVIGYCAMFFIANTMTISFMYTFFM